LKYKSLNDYEICYSIRENDDEALNIMFDKYLPIIKKMVSKFYVKYKNIGISYDDLIQEARIGLMKAINGYDESKSLFYSYAIMCIESQLITYCRNYNKLSNYPLNYNLGDSSIDNFAVSEDDFSYPERIYLENEKFFECKNLLKFDFSIVFELRYNEFTYKEISIFLDLPISTIDGRIRLIRNKLKNNLKLDF